MTLVFPDRAPSRFGVALRTGTLKQLTSSVPVDGTQDQQAAAEHVVTMVAALGRHDRMTRGHTERVRAYADLIAEQLKIPAGDRSKLQWAALVHDIGKLTVPGEILNSPSAPTDEEWATLKGHPAAGGEMVELLAPWLGEWRFAASQHHERWDGNGYPNGLSGEGIALAGRIVAVADAFDVITSTRSYKRALSSQAARKELVDKAGTQFDPEVVRALLAASLDRNPSRLVFLGWLAELRNLGTVSSGIGQVVAAGTTVAAVTVGAVTATPLLIDPVESTIAARAPVAEVVTDADAGPHRLPYGREPSIRDESEPGPGQNTSSSDQAGFDSPGMESPFPTVTGTADTGSPPETAPPTTAPGSATDHPTTTVATSAVATTTVPPTTTVPTTTITATTTAPTTAGAEGGWAQPDAATALSGSIANVWVLGNDAPPAGFDHSTLTVVSPPEHGAAEPFLPSGNPTNSRIRYMSAGGYTGVDRFTYRICDNAGDCSTAVATITVTSG